MNNRISELRKKNGYTQKELARLMNCTQSTIGGWETGARTPTLEASKKLADLFQTSVDYLMGWTIDSEESEASKKLKEDARTNSELWMGIKRRPDDLLSNKFNDALMMRLEESRFENECKQHGKAWATIQEILKENPCIANGFQCRGVTISPVDFQTVKITYGKKEFARRSVELIPDLYEFIKKMEHEFDEGLKAFFGQYIETTQSQSDE